MSGASPALLAMAAAKRVQPSRVPEHHVTALAALAHGSKFLTAGELWFLGSVLRLQALSERQTEKLLDIAKKVGRAR